MGFWEESRNTDTLVTEFKIDLKYYPERSPLRKGNAKEIVFKRE